MKKVIMLGVLAVGCILFAGYSQAQTTTMLNFTGFVYESDNDPGVQGFPPSDPGDVMVAVGFIESIGPELDWDMGVVELTFVISDLVSTGQFDAGSGLLFIVYNGGTLDIIANAYGGGMYTPPLYGVDPANATSPSTFWDGEIYLHGEFTSFYMTYHPTLHAGSFEGYLNWTSGTQLDALHPDPVGYTVAGTVGLNGAPVPDGYDLEADGHITFDPTIPVESNSWGEVKNLYR